MTKDLQRWADDAMFQAEPMPKDERGNVTPRVTLLWATPDPLGAVAAACRMYEGKATRNLADVTDDERRHYWEQVKRTHLKAPLEFVKLHFFVEGVTRAFTHQMVRQRTAVYAQESLRFAVKENMADEVANPPSLRASSDAVKADMAEAVWDDAIDHMGEAYNTLVNMGVPAEDARGLLPHATTTRLNYCTDLRALLDHAGNRLCTQAQFEWRMVIAQMVAAIRNHRIPGEPDGFRDEEGAWHDCALNWQFELIAGDDVFRPVCYTMGRCPFDSVMDRQCTIRQRVRQGKFDEIDDAEWLLDSTAGRRGAKAGRDGQ